MSWKGDTPFRSSESSRASKELVTMLGSVIFFAAKIAMFDFFLRLFWQSNLGKYISTWNLKYLFWMIKHLFYRNGCCNWMIKHLFYRNGFCNWMIKHLYLGSTCFYHLHPFETCWFRDLWTSWNPELPVSNGRLVKQPFSRWWNSNIFYFHPYLGKIPILTNILQMGWNHQPVFQVKIWGSHHPIETLPFLFDGKVIRFRMVVRIRCNNRGVREKNITLTRTSLPKSR